MYFFKKTIHVTILDDSEWMNLVNAPVILGHECSGVISAIGTDVNDYHVGVCPFDPQIRKFPLVAALMAPTLPK